MSSAALARTPATDRLAPSWFVPTAEQARRFGAHLQRELGPRHVLYGRAVTPIAARADADEVVFALGDGSGVALVHLTYAKRPAASVDWPPTTIFASLSAALDAVDR
jgi:hypothetical protein